MTLRRRDFITLLGGAATWPLAARAQQATLPVVASLNPGLPEASLPYVNTFRSGLAENGYVEGRNVLIEYHWLEGKALRRPIWRDPTACPRRRSLG